ncbi:hypothetical protein CA267_017020 [Alteromonas pelagimontana]|uniref:Secreted protein n=1 Tax=Alteromonas pelagimontana TaxID=1858656 RepID=A0A6M4MGL1_9ALTE|nr:hypothetical protein [Alteromonas pelagimontana]QJR82331.1 hypothetical protein CA267_017020 [Alteromonas pelagimontana]
MKKIIKIAVVSVIGLLSTTVAAAQLDRGASASFVENICATVPLLCSMTTNGNGSGNELPKPGDKRK